MPERIEQKIEISKAGFNAFVLNELADVKATQSAILEGLAELKASLENISFDEAFDKLNGKRLMYFTSLIEKIINDYGSIPDSDKIPAN